VGARLHVISGKGGTGKTTVAAALALALAADGHRTLLCEVEGRQGIAQLFDLPPLSYQERKIAIAPGGGDVFGLAIDAEAALLEYLDMFYRLGRAGRTLDKIGAIDFATTVAPGLRDVLLTGKVYEATRRRDSRGRYAYDAVVLDAPPTGRIARFLNVNTEVAGLARMGPVHRQAESITRFLRSRSAVVHLVTLLEEMPVQETVDGSAALTANGLRVGAVVVNMVREPLLDGADMKRAMAGKLSRSTVATGLAAAGLEPADAFVDALFVEASEHAQRITLEQAERKVLVELGRPIFELPLLADKVDLGGLYELAAHLTDLNEAV
jgi:anion-transporting  ArsA/GET3 family ATPase